MNTHSRRIFKKGEIIALPTETVYGLAVVFDNPDAYQKLVDLKKRPATQPFTMMCCSVKRLPLFIEIDDRIQRIIDNFMPGPLTIVAPVKASMPYHVTLGTGYIGIRVSDQTFIRDLIRSIGKPLLVPSANVHGEAPAKTTEEVLRMFEGKIPCVIEGEVVSNIPSTVIKIDKEITLIREGSIPFEEILKVVEE